MRCRRGPRIGIGNGRNRTAGASGCAKSLWTRIAGTGPHPRPSKLLENVVAAVLASEPLERQDDRKALIQSAFWHRFATTAHSPIGKAPERFGIELLETEPPMFARNELPFVDPTGCDHDFYAEGLRTALYNYMHGMGLDADPRSWFKARRGAKIPRTTVDPGLVRRALEA
jgi:hypothetical protein